MKAFLESLDRYTSLIDPEEQSALVDKFRAFVAENPPPHGLERTHFSPGHLTGSAVIVTEDFGRVLFTHHKKLNRWLQLGGHADGDSNLPGVALREAQEESGLENFTLVETPTPLFDLDIHWIPEGKEPGHFHYDARYLLTTPDPDQIVCSEESHALRWFPLDEAYTVTYERGMHRLLDKVRQCSKR